MQIKETFKIKELGAYKSLNGNRGSFKLNLYYLFCVILLYPSCVHFIFVIHKSTKEGNSSFLKRFVYICIYCTVLNMNLRIIALVFQFLINCWPKSNGSLPVFTLTFRSVPEMWKFLEFTNPDASF